MTTLAVLTAWAFGLALGLVVGSIAASWLTVRVMNRLAMRRYGKRFKDLTEEEFREMLGR